VGAAIAPNGKGPILFETEKGKTLEVSAGQLAGPRATRGATITKRDNPVRVIPPEPMVPTLREET
jgi:hypothetical protein